MSSQIRAARPSVNGWNAQYLEEQYERWRLDPEAVAEDLRSFFLGFELAKANGQAGAMPAAAMPTPSAAAPGAVTRVAPLGLARLDERDLPALPKSAAVARLMFHYRDAGHLCADLDPFGRERPLPEELSPQAHGLAEADLDLVFDASPIPMKGPAPLREIIRALDDTYCRTVGVEFMHVQDSVERTWLAERMESCRNRLELSRGERVHVMWQLFKAEAFEKFLHTRYPGEKRFSLEGCESLIPMLDRMIEAGANLGVEEIVLGMAHRGRLNVLNNILGKTEEQIFTEFEDNWEEDFVDGGGDVKYHRGYSGERATQGGKKVWLAMASNPSHLEFVGAVVEGRCRGKQRLRADTERRRVVPMLIHGDGAVIGQGVVAEIFNLSQLEGYTTGGTVHIVVNNQIGFTTGPEDARSTRYCTDIAKMIEAPIFHVNGEDPEACVHVAQMAMEYRQKFRKDVVIDMWGYRRWGHNESDEPSFTQPVMYALIKDKQSVLSRYAERLLAEGVITQADVDDIKGKLDSAFDKAQAASKVKPFDPTIDPGSRKWQGFGKAYSFAPTETGVKLETLQEVARAMGRTPKDFHLNRKLVALLKARAASCDSEDQEIDYATAESLAIGTLLVEATPVRISGQDARRGTFSHRHAALRDAENGAPYIPLNNVREIGEPGEKPAGSPGADGRPRQARLCVYDSPLSEAAVVGFDYGYSLSDPNLLVMWEAQFGDFANGAQVYFDQFLAPAELKWQRWNGLTLLLPHGYEGAGPEHSSCRIERFLQLCGDDNMQVVNPSTAAQIFHLLRRQVRRSFRKPLVVATPKSMLRTPTSRVRELVRGRFQEVIDDPMFVAGAADRAGVKRVILCSGKIYHEMAERRAAQARDDIALVRVEQLYPLHADLLRSTLDSYPKNAELVWTQEEPQNAGGFRYMEAALREQVGVARVGYIGRETSSTPAVGSKSAHKEEQEALITLAVGAAPGAEPEDVSALAVIGAPAPNRNESRPKASATR